MKKILTGIMVIVLTITSLYTSQTVYGAKVNAAEQQISTAAISNDMSVEGTNSFGELFADMAEEKQEEQKENQGYNVFSVVISDNQAAVSFETLEDCTLVVAIYDETGKKMLTSGSVEVKKGDTSAIAELDKEAMPQYFYLRCFLVENDTMRPLCTEYVSPNYTKEMQEFFAKTIHDFDSELVLNFDSDETDNFAVFNDETKIIPHKEGINEVVSLDEENGIYVFEKADEHITSLKEGDIFVCEGDTGENLIVKVGSVKTEGNKVSVKAEDTSMEEVFQYVKIDGKSNASSAKIDDTTCQQGTEYKGLVEGEVDSQKNEGCALSFSFLDKELTSAQDGTGGEAVSVKLNGSIKLAMDNTVKLYVSFSYVYLEFSLDYSLTGNVDVSGKISSVEIPLAMIGFSPIPGVYIEFIPSFVIEASGDVKINISIVGSVGFSISSDDGIRNLTSTPKVKPELKGEVKVFVGISLKPRLKIISSKIAEVSFEAMIGGEATATLSKSLDFSSAASKELPDKIHDCKNCVDGDIAVKCRISIGAKLLNYEKFTFSYQNEYAVKIGDFYYSIDRGEFGFTSCPHIFWKTVFKVKNESKNPVAGIKIFISPNGSGQFVIPQNMDEIGYVNELTTDSNGEATGYLPNGRYKISAEGDGDSGSRKITVKDNDKRIVIKVKRGLPKIKIYEDTVAAITKDGDLYMWGRNSDGQVGDGTTKNRNVPNKVLDNVASVSWGDGATKAVTKTGELYVWGYNSSIGLSNSGTELIVDKPMKVLDNVLSVSLDNGVTGVIKRDGELYMWGNNEWGQVGDGTKKNADTPKKVLDNVVSVDCAGGTIQAITKDGELYMWGNNSCGQIGDGTKEAMLTPYPVLNNVASVVDFDGVTTGAITKAGELYMWGNNSCGQVGDGTKEAMLTPYPVLDNVASISLRGETTGAITKAGELYMWGYNGCGQVGDGSTENKLIPTKVLDNVASVSLDGFYVTGAITKAGKLYMWGNNSCGQIGDGTKEAMLTPYPVLDNVASAVGFDGATVGAITKAGGLYMWGDNYYGQVGDGTTEDKLTPVKVLGNVASVSGDDNTLAAITKDGELYMWGYNGKGQIGDGTTENVPTPKLISYNVPSVSPSVKKASLNNNAVDEITVENTDIQKVVTTGENGSADGLMPNTVYNYYVMKSKSEEQPFTTDNLLYIGQAVSDALGSLHIDYEMKEEYANPETIVVGIEQLELSQEQVTVSDVVYNGKKQDIYPEVLYQGVPLTEGKDYEVFGDFAVKEVGEYTITIEGMGYYKGTVSKKYKVYTDGATLTPNPIITQATEAPTQTITPTPELTQTMPTLEPTKAVSATPTPEPKTENKKISKTYGDDKFSVAIKKGISLKYKSSKTSVAAVNKKGTVTIKGCGKSTITITNAETGHIYQKITLTVVPKKPTLSIQKTSTKEILKIKWKKDTKADGFEIYYGTDKEFSKKKSIFVNSKTTKKTLKNLKSKKKYYVKIRAYKNWNGTKLKGSFSKTVSVKVK